MGYMETGEPMDPMISQVYLTRERNDGCLTPTINHAYWGPYHLSLKRARFEDNCDNDVTVHHLHAIWYEVIMYGDGTYQKMGSAQVSCSTMPVFLMNYEMWCRGNGEALLAALIL